MKTEYDTEIIKVNPSDPEPEAIRRAAAWIRRGEPVAFPTETVYGLGANALDPEAAKKIYAAKGRPSDNPLIIHIADPDALAVIADPVPEAAHRLAEAFWPGPLTMIVPKSRLVPYETTGGLDTVAVRLPSHPVALALIRESGGFVAAPSANTSGRPSPTEAAHVAGDLCGRIPLILDGGSCAIGLESTIVDLSTDTPVILRPGYIDSGMLKSILGEVGIDPGLREDDDAPPKAPGMKYRHYAPEAELILIQGEPDRAAAYIRREVKKLEASGIRCGILCTEETADRYPEGIVKSIGAGTDEEQIARNLYRTLREFDAAGVQRIYSEVFDTPRLGGAIMNRLLKAAGHQMIKV